MAYTSPSVVEIVFENTQELSDNERDQIKDIEREFIQPEIDSKLNSEYDVPFDDYPDTPSAITMIATKLTAHAFIVFPGSGGSDNFQYAEELRDQAMEMLDALSDGDITLAEAEQGLDDSGFEFDGAKSEAFYNKALFIGSLDNPQVFGDISQNIDPDDDTDTIES